MERYYGEKPAFRLTDAEWEKVKEFIRKMRKQNENK